MGDDSYKNFGPCEGRIRIVQQFLADDIYRHRVLRENNAILSIEGFGGALNCLKTGQNVVSALKFLLLHLERANLQVLSLDSLGEAEIASFVLPLISPCEDYEILKYALGVANSLILLDQDYDSPFQNSDFIDNLFGVLQNCLSEAQSLTLLIIRNMLADQTIRKSICSSLQRKNFIDFLKDYYFFQKLEIDDIFSCKYSACGVLAEYLSCYDVCDLTDELIQSLLPLIVQMLRVDNEEAQYEAIKCLKSLFGASFSPQIMLKKGIPQLIAEQIYRFHSQGLPDLFICVSKFSPSPELPMPSSFLTQSFFETILHFLAIQDHNLVAHILQALEIYTNYKEHAEHLYKYGIMAGLKKVLNDGTFETRKLASFVIMDFCRVAESEWILHLGEDLLDLLVCTVQSYVPNDMRFFLACILELLGRGDILRDWIVGSVGLRELVEWCCVDQNGNRKVAELAGELKEAMEN
jgi:hypothetical protein